jgi:hypothetical protein
MQLPRLLTLAGRRNPSVDSPVFVMGCGRSGTHWLGRILGSHPDILAGIEVKGIFDVATQIALDPSQKQHLFPRLIRRYRRAVRRARPRRYADKSHPTLWFAEMLADEFPKARFVAIQRSPYATVNSMLQHAGVTRWTTMWREWTLPNHFLGITEELAAEYDGLPLAAKHALRWCSHARRVQELEASLGDGMLVVEYEKLHSEPAAQLRSLQAFLNLVRPFPEPPIKRFSLERWRKELSPSDREAIDEVLRRAGNVQYGARVAQ